MQKMEKYKYMEFAKKKKKCSRVVCFTEHCSGGNGSYRPLTFGKVISVEQTNG